MTANPTLMLVPGLLCDETVWQPVVDRFESEMRVVVADCSTQDSLTKMAEDALASVEGALYLAGHSMGARVALEMLRLAPQRILKLALVDTGVHPKKPGEEAKRQQMIDLANGQGMQALADQWLPPMVHPDRHNDKTLMVALNAMVLRMTPQLHARQIKALLNRPDIRLEDITCPVALIVGRQDAWSPVSQHETMLAHLADANLEIIEDAGHFAPIEQPQAFVSAIEKWVETDG